MADQNEEADFVETPEVGALRYLDEDPTEEESVEGDQNERMGKVPVILEIELAVEKAEHEIAVRKCPHSQACNCSPIPNFFIIDRSGNDGPSEGMSDGVHFLLLTYGWLEKQVGQGQNGSEYGRERFETVPYKSSEI
jgi:hypothetical protein